MNPDTFNNNFDYSLRSFTTFEDITFSDYYLINTNESTVLLTNRSNIKRKSTTNNTKSAVISPEKNIRKDVKHETLKEKPNKAFINSKLLSEVASKVSKANTALNSEIKIKVKQNSISIKNPANSSFGIENPNSKTQKLFNKTKTIGNQPNSNKDNKQVTKSTNNKNESHNKKISIMNFKNVVINTYNNNTTNIKNTFNVKAASLLGNCEDTDNFNAKSENLENDNEKNLNECYNNTNSDFTKTYLDTNASNLDNYTATMTTINNDDSLEEVQNNNNIDKVENIVEEEDSQSKSDNNSENSGELQTYREKKSNLLSNLSNEDDLFPKKKRTYKDEYSKLTTIDFSSQNKIFLNHNSLINNHLRTISYNIENEFEVSNNKAKAFSILLQKKHLSFLDRYKLIMPLKNNSVLLKTVIIQRKNELQNEVKLLNDKYGEFINDCKDDISKEFKPSGTAIQALLLIKEGSEQNLLSSDENLPETIIRFYYLLTLFVFGIDIKNNSELNENHHVSSKDVFDTSKHSDIPLSNNDLNSTVNNKFPNKIIIRNFYALLQEKFGLNQLSKR